MGMKFSFIPERITKEYLLSKATQETYLEYYLGLKVRKGLYKSPLRKDNSPTCAFFRGNNGDIVFKDFSGHFCGDFVKVVRYRNGNCSYQTALNIIANDFGYTHFRGLTKNPKPIQISTTNFVDKGSSEIRVEIQPFTAEELQWFGEIGITEKILKKFKVFSCKTVFLNNVIHTVSSAKYPSFGYYRGKNSSGIELWRIYYPNRKSYRFISNWKATMIQGGQQLPEKGDVLVVTKSMKDVMCLYSLGITSIAPNSENLFLTQAQYENLKKRFNHIVLFYDNDKAGLSNMWKFRHQYPDLKCVWLPKDTAKDISDFYRKYGREETLQIIYKAYRYLKIEPPEEYLTYAS